MNVLFDNFGSPDNYCWLQSVPTPGKKGVHRRRKKLVSFSLNFFKKFLGIYYILDINFSDILIIEEK